MACPSACDFDCPSACDWECPRAWALDMPGKDSRSYPAGVIGTRASFLFTPPRLEPGDRGPRA